MQSPAVQSLLENPDFMRSILESQPQTRSMMQNPEIARALRDPDTVRNLSRAATNPDYQRELVRSQDRQIANIMSLPGGMQALQRAFESVPDFASPGAAAPDGSPSSGGGGTGSGGSEAVPAASSMPNPWARGGGSSSSSSSASMFPFPSPLAFQGECDDGRPWLASALPLSSLLLLLCPFGVRFLSLAAKSKCG